MYMVASPSSKDPFEGSRVVIVGAGSPLGLAIAQSEAMRGAELILVDSRVLDFPEGLGNDRSVRVERCDVTDDQSVLELASRIRGPINGLIYLPRIRVRRAFGKVTMRDLLDDVAVTVGGLVLVAQAFSSGFESAYEQDSLADSFIICVSSVLASQVSMAESLTYHTAKAAQEQLVRYLAVTMGRWGVRANAVAPGWISKFPAGAGGEPFPKAVLRAHPLSRTGDLDDVSRAVVFLASAAARFITGQVLVVDGGMSLREAGSLSQEIASTGEW